MACKNGVKTKTWPELKKSCLNKEKMPRCWPFLCSGVVCQCINFKETDKPYERAAPGEKTTGMCHLPELSSRRKSVGAKSKNPGSSSCKYL